MIALLLAIALARSTGDPAPAADPPPDAQPAGGQARHDAALALLLEGRLAEAATAFERLAADPAIEPALAERARALAGAARAMDARGTFVLRRPEASAPPRAARLDQRGRGELALYSTAFGIWTGLGVGVLADLEDPRAYAALALAGGGGALALSTLGTRGRAVPVGRTQAIEAAGNWGSLNGGLVAGLAEAETRGVVGTTLGVGLLGLGAAVVLTADHAPSSGDVAVATSGGMWGLATGGLALLLVESPSDKVVMGTLLAATDLGLGGMILATRRIEISRGRSLLIDAGGLVGALVGLSVPLFARSENPRVYGVSGLLGLGAGLAGGTWLTRGWDDDEGADRQASAGGTVPYLTRGEKGDLRIGVAGRF